MYLRTWSSVKPYLAFSQTQKAVTEASDSRIGWPFRSAMVSMPGSGWAISTCGSFCMKAATAFTGAPSWARFRTMKLLEPMPSLDRAGGQQLGHVHAGPPWMIFTSRPRLAYSPVASAW